MFRFKTFFDNQSGFSITEVLISAGLLSIISLGVANMLENMSNEQKRVIVFNSLREVKAKIEFVIRDQNAWVHTMNNNPDFTCLKNNTPCNPIPTTPQKVVLYDSAGAAAYNLLDWGGGGSNGFTEAGQPCTTFSSNPATGVDACPFSYRLVYAMMCSGAATACTNPQIKVTGRLIYNPSTKGILGRFRNLVAVGNLAGAGISAVDSDDDDAKYDIGVRRTSSQLNRSFTVTMTADGATNCSVGGDLTCTTGVAAVHPKGWNPATKVDPFNLVNATGQNLQFLEAGYYNCNLSVTAFATFGFYAEFKRTLPAPQTVVGSAITVAGEWAQAAAVMDMKFNVASAGDTYQVWQKCDSRPSGRPSNPSPPVDNCTLGMNTDPYSTPGSPVVSLTCSRLEKVN